ncbi:ATP-binding cassette domain-containing protein [Haloglycomyces albus]|uniref:ATP-binding cassette domain-containing protein n=1 Tax=Haloglycomyces albus TaxID=526067 RepID=UPI00046D00E9|nr:ATP-binding cassette domain-containing protein [Haloglycomyces albus]
MSFSVSTRDLGLKYGATTALSQVTLNLEPEKIYGLLGRNGSGKTSLLSLLAGFRKHSQGSLSVGGQTVFENIDIVSQVCLIREGGDFDDSDDGNEVFDLCDMRPHWDGAYAASLADKWEVDLDKKVSQLSRGQRSKLAGITGLASGADLIMYDEVHLGMDAPSRDAFYREVLQTYMDRPHTVILSSHLIDEVASMLEEVIILDKGRVLLHSDKDSLDTMGATLTGSAEAVDGATASLEVLSEQRLGPTKSATVVELPDDVRRRLPREGVEINPIGLQDLFIHLTNPDR